VFEQIDDIDLLKAHQLHVQNLYLNDNSRKNHQKVLPGIHWRERYWPTRHSTGKRQVTVGCSTAIGSKRDP